MSGSGSSAALGTTQRAIRHILARECGYFGLGSVTTEASGIEAERYAISSGYRSDWAKRDRFDGLYLFINGGDDVGVQRKLVNGDFDGPLGAFKVDYPYAGILQQGTSFEISVLPAEDYLGVGGLNTAIDLALDTLGVLDHVLLTSDGTRRLSLAGYQWPIRGVQNVYNTLSATDDSLRSIGTRASFVNDAEGPYLQLMGAFADGVTVTAELIRPASSWIRQSGGWGPSTTGLTNDSDATVYDATTVVRMAKPIALEYLAQLQPRGSAERNEIMGEARDERATAALVRWHSSFRGTGVQRVGAR